MSESLTGHLAIHLLTLAGFRGANSGPTSNGGSFAEMVDTADRRIAVHLDAAGGLVNAIPTGEWARDLARDLPTWVNRPYVDSVSDLKALLVMSGVTK